ncbi:MAG: hypothetical protein ACT4P6_16015 [Gemmatimonadaceae bacterium]
MPIDPFRGGRHFDNELPSDREFEVPRGLGTGRSVKEVAAKLGSRQDGKHLSHSADGANALRKHG